MTPISRRLTSAAVVALLVLQGPMGVVAAQAQEARQTLNVQGADIRAFIQDVARSTGRTFIVDPAVTGTVTVTSDRPLNRTQMFEVFLSTLRANGLVVTPTSSGAYRISPAQGAAQGPATVGTERFTTEVFNLRNIDAASAAETIRPLVGAQGQVLANPGANSVVVADFADNLARVRALIGRIDVDRSSYDVVPLENASAREIAGVLQSVTAGPGGQGGLVTITAVESSNAVILRGDPTAVAKLRSLVADLDQRARSSADLKVVFLQHADAEQLLPVLQQLVGQTPSAAPSAPSLSTPRLSSAGGSSAPETSTNAASIGVSTTTATGQRAAIARFPGANALVISGPADLQRSLGEVIRQLDVRRQQVLIEAIVVELSDTAVRELGVQWLVAGEQGVGLTNYSDRAAPLVPIAGGAASGQLDKDDPIREQLHNLALNTLVGANGFVGGAGGSMGDGLFGFVINAAKSDENSNLLQTPSLMTLDNQEATILVGQEVPITTGSTLLDGNTNPFTTTERKDIGVKLIVRPQINAGGSITLSLRQEVSSINGVLTSGASDLVLNKRELETTQVVDDGDIAVAGGLLDQNDRLSVDKVPGLGDLPGVGALFRSNARQRGRTNLMVFIRPTIIRSAADAQNLTADRWGYIRGEQVRTQPGVEPSLDALLRDYMQAQPPAAAPSAGTPLVIAPVEAQALPPAHNAVSPVS
ncbi:type II secretion system secretin GspD [Brevundimonas sp.]|uniref:type II secretion system secretin GspD n=1 Tax=Brevundimonas sp. TaxID=1871086 RepID=UPI004034DA1D